LSVHKPGAPRDRSSPVEEPSIYREEFARWEADGLNSSGAVLAVRSMMNAEENYSMIVVRPIRPIRPVRSDTILVEPSELIVQPREVIAASDPVGGAVSNIPTGRDLRDHHEPHGGTI